MGESIGGLLGCDSLVLEMHLTATANIKGVIMNVIENLPIVQAAAKIETLSVNGFIALRLTGSINL
eukprot:scaffold6701_cov181-Amphora_coffeaeformis.AAC.1